MEITAYQKEILIWIYGLQNYQGIFANVPPPPAGIVPPVVSQAPGGEAWIAYSTVAAEVATSPTAIQDIPGTAVNDPQAAIWAMPEYVIQGGGSLFLTLAGAQAVERIARVAADPALAEEALANIATRLAILSRAGGEAPAGNGGASSPVAAPGSPRWDTNEALLARAGYLVQDMSGVWQLTADGSDALKSLYQVPSSLLG